MLNISEHAEADAFFCFTHLMGEIKDNFLKTLDDSACGIGNKSECVFPVNVKILSIANLPFSLQKFDKDWQKKMLQL